MRKTTITFITYERGDALNPGSVVVDYTPLPYTAESGLNPSGVVLALRDDGSLACWLVYSRGGTPIFSAGEYGTPERDALPIAAYIERARGRWSSEYVREVVDRARAS